jgi:CBS domain-containing protein
MEPLDFIKISHPFDQLDGPALQRIARQLEIVYFPAGTRILSHAGPPSQHLCLIRKGHVQFTRNEQLIMELEAGEWFGYASMLAGAPPYDVTAVHDTLVYRVPEKIFHELMAYPVFAEFFLKGLSERLRRSVNQPQTISSDLALPVGQLIARPPIFVTPETTVAVAARLMRDEKISSVLVNAQPVGIVTDRDLRGRVLAASLGPETLVREVMSQPAQTLPYETPVYGAMLFLLEAHIHHLPITQNQTIVGVVTDSDLLRYHVKSPIYLLKRVSQLGRANALQGYAQEVAATVESLFHSGLEVTRIGQMIANLNDTLIKRLLVMAEADLGPPPTPYAWLVFGSEGRMEQTLLTDQDNALAYQTDAPEAQAYFRALTERVIAGLISAGFPPCAGGYMATRWQYPLAAWTRLFNQWVLKPEPRALLEAAIFFDFRVVHGSLSLDPLNAIMLKSDQHKIFLAQLARAALEFHPPLGLFQRIQATAGGVDLKRDGLAPIVGLARLYALAADSLARSTTERLTAAEQASVIGPEEAETLREAFGFLLRLRLREQLRALRAGEQPSNRVRLDTLSPVERRHLKEVFVAIHHSQEAVAFAYQTNRLG